MSTKITHEELHWSIDQPNSALQDLTLWQKSTTLETKS